MTLPRARYHLRLAITYSFGNTQQPIPARSDQPNGPVQNPSNPDGYRA